ncbi:GNAT family N-acetyltransferase [Kribbella flavida]|uniref:GNAT family N-acetyltransferase n=1 Tax=Kribbella flavida TaxID=182640 RepID=UPI0013051BF0|nr:GNAT family N-acetyltransferase [Kribbella flavida]
MDVEVLAEDDWAVLRQVRLRALDDSPAAFLSSYQAEAAAGEEYWRHRCLAYRWVVARNQHRAVGLVCSVKVLDRPADERHLESIWVDPAHRRQGVLRAMLHHLAELEPEVRSWLVWVLDGNDEARAIYERLGFASTGERQLLSTLGRSEERMRLESKAAVRDLDDPGSVP